MHLQDYHELVETSASQHNLCIHYTCKAGPRGTNTWERPGAREHVRNTQQPMHKPPEEGSWEPRMQDEVDQKSTYLYL